VFPSNFAINMNIPLPFLILYISSPIIKQGKQVDQSDLECVTDTNVTDDNVKSENENDECNNVETSAENSEEVVNQPCVEKSLLDDSDSDEMANLDTNESEEVGDQHSDTKLTNETDDQAKEETIHVDNREDEFETLGAEVIFENNKDLAGAYNGWDNLRWMSYSGIRKISAAKRVFRFFEGRRGFLWSTDEYVPRKMVIYEEPNIILILREARDFTELRDLLDVPKDKDFEDETSLESYLFVESVIDPKTAKIRLSPLTTATSVIPNMSNDCPRRRSTFELINPAESIVISAIRERKNDDMSSYVDSGAFLETSEVEYLLTKSICSAQEHSDSDFSWKHQIVLGTLHSHIVLGNQDHLDKGIFQALRTKNGQSHLDMAILQASEKMSPKFLNPRIIDAIDESGKTPLHYACESRFSSAVSSLVKAGADVTKRIDLRNMTPCHISANNLDFRSLEAILSVSRQPNEVDDLGRSPMYLAITEGRSVGGQLDPKALERCIATLAKFGGQVGQLMENRHPVSYLAYMCQPNEMELVLKYSQYKYPLHTTKASDLGISVSALYEYPIHSALISLKHRLQNLTLGGCIDSQQILRDCADLDSSIVRTLMVLFSCGFEPNERIEGLSKTFREMEDIMEYVGFCPTQILMASVLEIASQRKALGEELYASISDKLANILECLTLHGARIFPDLPPLMRSEERPNYGKKIEFKDGSHDVTKRDQLKMQGNLELSLLCGRVKIVEAQSRWKNSKPSPPPSNVVLHDDKDKIENSMAPGGSDERSCAICWKKFGLITRKHRCRISRRFVCDECSSHRIVVNGIEHRITDGQFLLAKAEEMKEVQRRLNATQAQEMQRRKKNANLEAEENSNRESLFGSMTASVAKTFGLTDDTSDKANKQSEADTISGLSNQLNQTRDALNERGAKLSALSDKSDKLVNASQDFAAMAKELNRSSSGGFFSGW